MKSTLIMFLCLGLSQAVFAQDTGKKVSVKAGYETLNMKQLAPPGDLPQTKKPLGLTKVGCLDSTGRTFSQGDPGFETCVMNRTPKNPGDNPSNINVEFGR